MYTTILRVREVAKAAAAAMIGRYMGQDCPPEAVPRLFETDQHIILSHIPSAVGRAGFLRAVGYVRTKTIRELAEASQGWRSVKFNNVPIRVWGHKAKELPTARTWRTVAKIERRALERALGFTLRAVAIERRDAEEAVAAGRPPRPQPLAQKLSEAISAVTGIVPYRFGPASPYCEEPKWSYDSVHRHWLTVHALGGIEPGY
jgi:hypothetical protein